MHSDPRDLFGDVPVSTVDVDAWLLHVAKLSPDSPRAANYIRQWSVVEKIKRAKLEGSFETFTQAGASPHSPPASGSPRDPQMPS